MSDTEKYIFRNGYHGKIFQRKKHYYGEVLNTDAEAIFDGNSVSDVTDTFCKGIDEFSKAHSKEKHDGLTGGELIAELALALKDADIPCCLKDGTPITGVYIDYDKIILDINEDRSREIIDIIKNS